MKLIKTVLAATIVMLYGCGSESTPSVDTPTEDDPIQVDGFGVSRSGLWDGCMDELVYLHYEYGQPNMAEDNRITNAIYLQYDVPEHGNLMSFRIVPDGDQCLISMDRNAPANHNGRTKTDWLSSRMDLEICQSEFSRFYSLYGPPESTSLHYENNDMHWYYNSSEGYLRFIINNEACVVRDAY